MKRLSVVTFLAILLGVGIPPRVSEAEEHAPPGLFAEWTTETFAKAKRERKILLVMVSTSWCHWCHVMKRTTYRDPRVRRLLDARFAPILVDADARPDLAERFRNYRWPATAFLTSEGKPILAIRGHRYANAFLSLLQDITRRVDRGGPFPGFTEPHVAGGAQPGLARAGQQALRSRLITALDTHYDRVHAGWGTGQKYPVSEPVLWGLHQHMAGHAKSAPAVRSLKTLEAMAPLLDREWGGVYQYSVGPGWDAWHPEKIISVNAGALRNYVTAYTATKDPRWLRSAQTTARWFTEVLPAPGGGFYASQDADSADLAGEKLYRLPRAQRERYKRPRVDPHVYARENGWVARALLDLHGVTGDAKVLARAKGALARIWRENQDALGLLRHEASDTSPRRFVMDQIAAARAALALHQVTGDPTSLERAVALAKRADTTFRIPTSGGLQEVVGEVAAPGALGTPLVSLETGAAAAQLYLRLSALDATHPWRRRAAEVVRAAGSERQIKAHWRHVGGLLLAVEALLRPQLRIEVLVAPGAGDRDQGAEIRAMRAAARGLARTERGVVWTERDAGPSERVGTAFLCGEGVCSDPVTDPLFLGTALQAFRATLSK